MPRGCPARRRPVGQPGCANKPAPDAPHGKAGPGSRSLAAHAACPQLCSGQLRTCTMLHPLFISHGPPTLPLTPSPARDFLAAWARKSRGHGPSWSSPPTSRPRSRPSPPTPPGDGPRLLRLPRGPLYPELPGTGRPGTRPDPGRGTPGTGLGRQGVRRPRVGPWGLGPVDAHVPGGRHPGGPTLSGPRPGARVPLAPGSGAARSDRGGGVDPRLRVLDPQSGRSRLVRQGGYADPG